MFLAEAFNAELTAFSRLELYTAAESDRREFDFSSVIERGWSRVLVGQTLWRHSAGIEKDVRSLLFEHGAQIKAYIVREDAAVAGRVATVLDEFRTSGRVDDQLFRLVRFAVPVFDADKEEQRAFVARRLREQIIESLLMQVVFGGISARDVCYLLHPQTWRRHTSLEDGRALELRLLDYLRHPHDYMSLRSMASDLDTSQTHVRRAVDHLRASEFIDTPGIDYVMTDKGRVFLDLLDRFGLESRAGVVSAELRFLLDHLGLRLDEVLDVARQARPEDAIAPINILLFMMLLARGDIPQWDLGDLEWMRALRGG